MSTLTSFALFSELPVEIRLKIYAYDLSTPRTVKITCEREAVVKGGPRSPKSFSTTTPPPPLLHVNRETRFEALAVYAPYLATKATPRPIYLNMEQDTISFPDATLPHVPLEVTVEISRMVLQSKDCAYFATFNMEVIKKMSQLKALDILAEKNNYPNWSNPDRYLNHVRDDFELAKEHEPTWECPAVRIIDEDGTVARLVEGGALNPDWVAEPAHFSGDEDD